MNIKVGDIISFKSTGYKNDGSWNDKKFLQYATITDVKEDYVSAIGPKQKSWDHINKDEIIDIWHREVITTDIRSK